MVLPKGPLCGHSTASYAIFRAKYNCPQGHTTTTRRALSSYNTDDTVMLPGHEREFGVYANYKYGVLHFPVAESVWKKWQ